MELMLAILFWLLMAIVTLVVLALITPVLVSVHLNNSSRPFYRIEIRAFSGIAPRLTVGQKRQGGADKKSDQKPQQSKKHTISRLKRVDGAAVRALPKLILGVLRRIHLVELHIDGVYGLGDPAETGQLCGMLMPLQYANSLPSVMSLDLRPDFHQQTLRCNMTAVVRVTVAALFVPAAEFVWRIYGPRR